MAAARGGSAGPTVAACRRFQVISGRDEVTSWNWWGGDETVPMDAPDAPVAPSLPAPRPSPDSDETAVVPPTAMDDTLITFLIAPPSAATAGAAPVETEPFAAAPAETPPAEV